MKACIASGSSVGKGNGVCDGIGVRVDDGGLVGSTVLEACGVAVGLDVIVGSKVTADLAEGNSVRFAVGVS
jgi:hypothetical protein